MDDAISRFWDKYLGLKMGVLLTINLEVLANLLRVFVGATFTFLWLAGRD
jgi:hypothetical protein